MYRKFHEDMQELVQSDYRGDGGEGWERIFLDLSYIKEINYPKERVIPVKEGRDEGLTCVSRTFCSALCQPELSPG